MCFLLHTHLFVISFIHLLSVEMSNGCICCTLREDLLVEVKKIASSGDFDYLLIESRCVRCSETTIIYKLSIVQTGHLYRVLAIMQRNDNYKKVHSSLCFGPP